MGKVVVGERMVLAGKSLSLVTSSPTRRVGGLELSRGGAHRRGVVTIRRCFNSADAQLIHSLLDASGLHPEVVHELSSLSLDGYALAAGGILVQVPEGEAEFAAAIVATPDPPTSSALLTSLEA